MPNFIPGTKYRFEGVSGNSDGLWKVTGVNQQVGFQPIIPHGSTSVDSSGTQFYVHVTDAANNIVAIESVDYPGHYLTQFRNPNETHPHLRANMVILEQGAPTDDTRKFQVCDPIWEGESTINTGGHFTLKWNHFVVVTGVGGLNIAPYTAPPDRNWGFVFDAVNHALEITVPGGSKIETPPYDIANYGSLAMARQQVNNYAAFTGTTGWRLPTALEMEAVLKYLKDNNLFIVPGAWWTNEAAATHGQQVTVGYNPNTQTIATGQQRATYPFAFTRPVRNITT